MPKAAVGQVAIIDYGMGNLFSVRQACEFVGLQAVITSTASEIRAADAVILPGVGAFRDAMTTLERLDLVKVLQDIAASAKPLMGICLGMQLLMTESYEFGNHVGLGIIDGPVVSLRKSVAEFGTLKVPQVGWNRIYVAPTLPGPEASAPPEPPWKSPLLQDLSNGEYMYFVHSFYSKPTDPEVVVSTTKYGPVEFCSSLSSNNIFACQFHPERSGPGGLQIYRNFAKIIKRSNLGELDVRETGSQVRTT